MHAGLSEIQIPGRCSTYSYKTDTKALSHEPSPQCLSLSEKKQEQNFAKPHRVNAQTEVPGARRTHNYQVLAVPPMKWFAGERMAQNTLDSQQLLVTNHKRRVQLKVSDPLGRLTRHNCVLLV